MDRRGFLKGTFGGLTAGGILLAAPLADIDMFAKEAVEGMPLIATPTDLASVGVGMMLFNHKGEPVAVIHSVHQTFNTVDVTSMNDSWRHYARGGMTTEIRAICAGPVRIANIGGK